MTTSRDGHVKSAETRQGWKHKATLLQKYHGKERLEGYSTFVAWLSYLLVFLYFYDFSLAGLSPCVFIPALFVHFLQAHPYLELFFTENCLLLVYVPFFAAWQQTLKVVYKLRTDSQPPAGFEAGWLLVL